MTARKTTPHLPKGRPSLYKPEYCNEVINVCSEGLSLTAFAGVIGVSRDIISDWMKAHPEFRLACTKAMAKRGLFLERGMIDPLATGPMVTARRFALVNAHVGHGEQDWREKQEIAHQNPDGSALQFTTIYEAKKD